MARKTEKITTKEFTKNIHSTRRSGTRFANMENWNEKEAKENKKLVCADCRFHRMGCDEYVGKYHKTCPEFKWW